MHGHSVNHYFAPSTGDSGMSMVPFWTALQKYKGSSNLICMLNQTPAKQSLKLEELSKASLTLVLGDMVPRLFLFLVSLIQQLRRMMDF